MLFYKKKYVLVIWFGKTFLKNSIYFKVSFHPVVYLIIWNTICIDVLDIYAYYKNILQHILVKYVVSFNVIWCFGKENEIPSLKQYIDSIIYQASLCKTFYQILNFSKLKKYSRKI